MKPDSNQPAHLYGTNKTPKVENLEGITVANLKLRPTIDQTGTFTYNVAKVISEYLRTLCENEYSINDTQKCPNILSSIQHNKMARKIYHTISSTNVAIEETINYIIEQNLVKR